MSSINLATPPAEIRSFGLLCELQPFLDARLLEAMQGLSSMAYPAGDYI